MRKRERRERKKKVWTGCVWGEREGESIGNIHQFSLFTLAGFCVKTRNIISSQKVFINICHTDVIPQPVDINESDLIKILESDEPSTFRVPMSIGECHEEVDKCTKNNLQ